MKKLLLPLLTFCITSSINCMDLENQSSSQQKPVTKSVEEIKDMSLDDILNTNITMNKNELISYITKYTKKTCYKNKKTRSFLDLKTKSHEYKRLVQHAIYILKGKPGQLQHFKHQNYWKFAQKISDNHCHFIKSWGLITCFSIICSTIMIVSAIVTFSNKSPLSNNNTSLNNTFNSTNFTNSSFNSTNNFTIPQ